MKNVKIRYKVYDKTMFFKQKKLYSYTYVRTTIHVKQEKGFQMYVHTYIQFYYTLNISLCIASYRAIRKIEIRNINQDPYDPVPCVMHFRVKNLKLVLVNEWLLNDKILNVPSSDISNDIRGFGKETIDSGNT